ncbi:MAG: hypothetical protein IJV30_11140 [Oscillospiraceae bacterium]|nr:hypothetical protein [Oscillospiraceae bacterium]
MRYINFEVMIIAFVALSFLWTLFKIIRVRMLGVEVNAFITRLEEHETTDADGIPSEYYEVYVRYQTKDGRTVNTSLANSTAFLNVGDLVRIKYIPGQEDYPVLA